MEPYELQRLRNRGEQDCSKESERLPTETELYKLKRITHERLAAEMPQQKETRHTRMSACQCETGHRAMAG